MTTRERIARSYNLPMRCRLEMKEWRRRSGSVSPYSFSWYKLDKEKKLAIYYGVAKLA